MRHLLRVDPPPLDRCGCGSEETVARVRSPFRAVVVTLAMIAGGELQAHRRSPLWLNG